MLTLEAKEKPGIQSDTTNHEGPFQPESEGPLRRKSLLLAKVQNPTKPHVSPTKVLPVRAENIVDSISSFEKKDSKYSKARRNAASKRHTSVKSLVFQSVMATTVWLCVAWTVWLILLNVAPNDMANRIMNTVSFDNGSFWLMVDPPTGLVGIAAFGLTMVAVSYINVFIKMIPTRKSTKYLVQVPENVKAMQRLERVLNQAAENPNRGKVTSTIIKLAAALAHEDSSARKHAKLLVKFGDLALETLLLYQMLESGSPVVLIGVFTVIVASNALICAAMLFVPYKRAPLAEPFIDIVFDFLIAIGYPMLVVAFCLSTFSFDRAKFAINLEVFPTGMFEQSASVVADPVETAIIYKSLKSLRIMSILDFLTRMGVNGMFCFRLRSIAELIQSPAKQQSSVYPKRNRVGAALLIVFTTLLVVFVEESIRTSTLACQPHPECAVNARRWTLLEDNSLTQCPCLTLIDRDIAPKTYAEWETPKNLTEKVAQLAAMGELQTLQLTNRYLPAFPDELRRCTNLKHLSLEYTHMEAFPAWIKEFSSLEYLHVESKFTSPMTAMPDDMFEAMSSLTFIHFAAFLPMKTLPSFDGLSNLKSLTLAVFLAMEELPAFDSLKYLERLVLSSLPAMTTLPDFSSIKNLKSFGTSDRGAWCCNGYLGYCHLEDAKCGVHPVWGSPAATCLLPNRTDNLPTAATLKAVDKFSSSICGPVLQAGVLEGAPTAELMAPCNGTLYRQCPTPDGVEAMCYNARFMGIACTTSQYPIEMRRRQIARGVGDACDPAVEAWLGCK